MKLRIFISSAVILAVVFGFCGILFAETREIVSEDANTGDSMGTGEEGLSSKKATQKEADSKQLKHGQDISPEAMAGMMSGMNQSMSKMMTMMYSAILDLFAQKDTAAKLASFTKNYYDELVKLGFKEEEALKIVASAGMPSLSK